MKVVVTEFDAPIPWRAPTCVGRGRRINTHTHIGTLHIDSLYPHRFWYVPIYSRVLPLYLGWPGSKPVNPLNSPYPS